MDFDQLASPKQLDRVGVSPGQQPLPDQLPRHRIDRSGYLNMAIRRDFGTGVDRDHERSGRGRQQQRCFLLGEHLTRARAGGAVDAGAGDLGAPQCGAGPAVRQVGEVFTGEEAGPYVLHTLFDARFIFGMANPRRVNHEASSLDVFTEAVVQSRLGVIGLVDDRFHVIRDDDLEHATKERPGRLEPGDHLI
jgi:hypothetical protein